MLTHFLQFDGQLNASLANLKFHLCALPGRESGHRFYGLGAEGWPCRSFHPPLLCIGVCVGLKPLITLAVLRLGQEKGLRIDG